MSKDIEVNEAKRKIAFVDGTILFIRGVKSFNIDGNWLRIKSDEGYFVINPDKILYHQIYDLEEVVR